MKTFTFLAKQGQHNNIAIILTKFFGKPRLERYNGPRGKGVMITLKLKDGVSKRAVDRLLHDWEIPGSRSRRNKLPVVRLSYNGDCSKFYHGDFQLGQPFKAVLNGKFMPGKQMFGSPYSCECCWYITVIPYQPNWPTSPSPH